MSVSFGSVARRAFVASFAVARFSHPVRGSVRLLVVCAVCTRCVVPLLCSFRSVVRFFSVERLFVERVFLTGVWITLWTVDGYPPNSCSTNGCSIGRRMMMEESGGVPLPPPPTIW